MTAGTFVGEKQASEFALLQAKSAKLNEYTTTQRTSEQNIKRTASTFNLELLAAVIVAIIMMMVGQVVSLRARDPIQFDWYDGKKQGDEMDGKYGRLRGPKALGTTAFTMTCVSIAQAFPALYQVLNTFGMCKALHPTSAQFLIVISQVFFRQLQDIHWAGTAEQLGHAELDSYLKSYSAWSAPANKWSFLYKDEASFETAAAVLSARDRLVGSYLDSLFRGGLCLLSVEQYNADDDEIDMCKKLIGSEPVYLRSCYAQKLAAGVKVGFNTAAGMYAGVKVAKVGLRTAGAASKAVAEKGVGGAVKDVGKEVAAKTARNAKYLAKKIARRTVAKVEKKAAEKSAKDGAIKALRSKAFRKGAAQIGKKQLGSAAEKVGQKIGSKVVEKAGARMAASLATDVIAEEAVGDATAACAAAATACFIAEPVCLAVCLAAGGLAEAALLAVSVAVGCAAGAGAAAAFKCPGTKWYTLERGNDGKIITKNFSGDPLAGNAS